MIRLGRSACGDLEIASRREWLETNGVGGYACGTVAGLHTRGYHGLLAASLDAPLRRASMLSHLEETVSFNGHKLPISTTQYRDAVAPRGYLQLEEFRLDPFPVFLYRIADQLVEKRIFMTHGRNLTWVLYRLLTRAEEDVWLTVRPLVNFRDHHLRRRERHFVNTHHDLAEHAIRLLPTENLPTLTLYHNAVGYEHSALWYQNLFYREEKERGLECEEDVFSPGVIRFKLSADAPCFLAATMDTHPIPDPEEAARAEVERRAALTNLVPDGDVFGQSLLRAADQFLVKRGEGVSVIAGYPWMGDCGRDAMLSLPGLTLSTRRFDRARALLETYAGFCSEGMLPNHFTEENSQPMYNSVDSAFWFFTAVDRYRRAAGDLDFVREKLWPVMEEIVDCHLKGTRYRIRMDDDGLINLPEEAAQLTWMDAQVGDWVVTPRSGKPVEINALWYNALCLMRDLAREFRMSEAQENYGRLAEKIKTGFLALFWNEKGQCLFDRVEDHFQDPTLRPNQLLAVSLPYPVLEGEAAGKILNVVRKELYTTFGFRTLNRSDPNYHGNYSGNMINREGSAHQGSVWPWLLGAYADGMRRVYGNTPAVREELARLIHPFESHLWEAGLGTISEMFDAEPPHAARGCLARAWNVAEILRLYLELKAE